MSRHSLVAYYAALGNENHHTHTHTFLHEALLFLEQITASHSLHEKHSRSNHSMNIWPSLGPPVETIKNFQLFLEYKISLATNQVKLKGKRNILIHTT